MSSQFRTTTRYPLNGKLVRSPAANSVYECSASIAVSVTVADHGSCVEKSAYCSEAKLLFVQL